MTSTAPDRTRYPGRHLPGVRSARDQRPRRPIASAIASRSSRRLSIVVQQQELHRLHERNVSSGVPTAATLQIDASLATADDDTLT